MPRPLLFVIAFMLFGTCGSFGQDVKNDSKLESQSHFEGKEAGDRKEFVPGIFFRWCPAGKFKMGSPETELGMTGKHESNENQVEVVLTKGFWLGETEITQGQWQELMGTRPWKGNKYVKEGHDFAASYISHDDADTFCKQLTSQERSANRLPQGLKYSLPTEAQWEYACRAGTTTEYSFGNDASKLKEFGWFGGLKRGGNATTEPYVHQVGLKKSNPWGLKDMHGNVWEWCMDWYDDKLPGGQDAFGADTGSDRVQRGGALHCFNFSCRSAYRSYDSPGCRFYDVGLRLAVVPE